MKLAAIFLFILSIVIAGILYKAYQSSHPEEQCPPFEIKIDREQFLKSMRKISFENHMNHGIAVQLRFTMTDEDDEDEHEHYLDANSAGWIPYFVPGILRVTVNKDAVDLDITAEQKEYKVIIADNGTISTEILDLTD